MQQQQQRQTPIEGNHESEAQTPTRTGDNVPTSDLTPREVKTMTLAPLVFVGIAAAIALLLVVVYFIASR